MFCSFCLLSHIYYTNQSGSQTSDSGGSSGAVIGGVVGGVVVIAAIIIVVLFVLIYMRQLHQKRLYTVKAGITNTISDGKYYSHSCMSQFKPAQQHKMLAAPIHY